jgi:hypothetical protein
VELEDAAIDRYFWDDKDASAVWRGPVRNYAKLMPLEKLSQNVTINNNNIIGTLKAGDLAVIRGIAGKGASAGIHWMLATLFRTNDANVATHLVANDPWTGRQVLIDVKTRRVVSPGFPLTDFKVDGYRVVKLN